MTTPAWLHRYILFTNAATLLLLVAGALVTGTGSGLAVPDWPLSYGQFFPPMVGGILYEHGHRLVAGTVAILTFFLLVFVLRFEKSKLVRGLAIFAMTAVLTQALLGGLTVLLRLPKAVSISHACLAQIFFSTITLLSLITSPTWRSITRTENTSLPYALKFICYGLNALFFSQLILGASVRHFKAGLAIPDFPTVFGHWVPQHFDLNIAVHYAHRIGAFTLVICVGALSIWTLQKQYRNALWTAFVGLLNLFIFFQVFLGAGIIWAKRPIPLTTAHLAIGACTLATSFLLSALATKMAAPRSVKLSAWTLEGSPA